VNDAKDAVHTSSATGDVGSTPTDNCLSAEQGFVSALIADWPQVASAGFNSSGQQIAALGWATKYETGLRMLARQGCDSSSRELMGLGEAEDELRLMVSEGFLLDDAVPQVTAALASTAETLRVPTVSSSMTCADLKGVHANYRLVSGGESSREYWPRLTIRNRSEQGVTVDYQGTGSASNQFAPRNPLTMSWGYYGPARVASGATKVLNLGLSTGETLYVGEGEKILFVRIHARMATADGMLSGCPLGIRRK
jgi:hypothetical protein